ncbi:ribose-phosphate pyrophosphokinase [Cysteiniphilum sp. QT6929]|uniref:ribose-phosphate pyrophosphokinase n=1 Tax=Cysteiniphilum sp. QT6929 TaxID=2975055 RepID=UPI0024B3344A|nr:ribose-phosphate pyrophosphokinase [Cysteiniphilum sp. QT6929]WHN66416.1 ribose-phosphate pyrophosphokinase [Cysteiniphilum sp. QT6929]
MSDLMLFSGRASSALTEEISHFLGVQVGRATVSTFSDGESHIEIIDNVRGRDVFIVQSTCPPTNDHIMELMFLTDALRRSSAGRITAVIPYFGYARQDRRVRSSRVPISARVVADMLTGAGIDRLLTVDIHAEQIQGFFNIPLDNVYGTPILLDYIRSCRLENPIVVSPDVGGVVRARAMAKALNTDLAIIDKRRQKANESEVMNIIGDISGRHCLIVDDIVDTAGTLCKAAQALIDHGAKKVSAYCVHPVLSGKAIENIEGSILEELVVTNSIPLHNAALKCKKIKTLSLAPMLSEAIRRTNNEESISLMFCDLI